MTYDTDKDGSTVSYKYTFTDETMSELKNNVDIYRLTKPSATSSSSNSSGSSSSSSSSNSSGSK